VDSLPVPPLMPAKRSAKPTGTPRARIIDAYWRHRLIEGRPPHSVFAFCESIGIGEETFHAEFSGFAAIESAWWTDLATTTISTLEQDSDYGAYDARQRLLAFHYTLVATAQPCRSRLTESLPPPGPGLPAALRPLHTATRPFFEALVRQGIADKLIADRGKLSDLYPRALWEQLRWILDYHRRDTSAKFEDTDAFIEKSVRLFFDAAGTGVVESALDLARFLARHLPKAP